MDAWPYGYENPLQYYWGYRESSKVRNKQHVQQKCKKYENHDVVLVVTFVVCFCTVSVLLMILFIPNIVLEWIFIRLSFQREGVHTICGHPSKVRSELPACPGTRKMSGWAGAACCLGLLGAAWVTWEACLGSSGGLSGHLGGPSGQLGRSVWARPELLGASS